MTIDRGLIDTSLLGAYINLMGHSKWSWMNAYRNRYGLIRDDIHTQKKTLKKSAYWYRKLSDTNELDAD